MSFQSYSLPTTLEDPATWGAALGSSLVWRKPGPSSCVVSGLYLWDPLHLQPRPGLEGIRDPGPG